MTLPLAVSASPWLWLPFAGYFVAVLAAIWAVAREGSAAGDIAPEEDDQRDQQRG